MNVKSAQNVKRTRAFAQAIGVDCWVARKPLAGANRHRCYPISAMPIEAISTEALPDETSLAAGRAGLLTAAPSGFDDRSLAAELSSSNAEELRVVKDIATSDGRSTSVGNQHENRCIDISLDSDTVSSVPSNDRAFTLIALQSDDVLLLDDISQMRLTPSAYATWINAILSVLNVSDVSQQGISQGRFSWPMQSRQNVPQFARLDSNVMMDPKKVFTAWLAKTLSRAKKHPARVILMGEMSAIQLGLDVAFGDLASLSHIESLPAAGQISSNETSGAQHIQAVLTLSSNQLWHKPLSKSLFWSHIQALLHA